MKRWILWGLPALIVVAMAGMWLLSSGRGDPARPIALAYLPEQPARGTLPPLFGQRLERAEQAVREDGDVLAAMGTLSALYHANGFLGEAIQVYEGLLELEPGEARWWHRLAVIIAGYGYLEDAVPLWEETVTLRPDYMPARIRLGDAWLKLNRFDEAARVMEETLQVDPENAYALTVLGRVAMARSDEERAIAYLERAVQSSDYRVGADLLADVYGAAGQLREAEALREAATMGAFVDLLDPWMDEMLSECYDPGQIANAGGIAIFRGDPGRGVQLLERAVSLAPDDPFLRYQLGEAASKAGDREKARRHLTRATELKPDLADAWIRLISLSLQEGRQDEAARLVFEGIEHCPDSPAMNIEMARYHESRGSFRSALTRLRKSAELRPNEAAAFLWMARIHFQLENVEAGMEAMREALAAEPGNAAALVSLALYAIQTADEAEAEAFYKRAALQPGIPRSQLEQIRRNFLKQFGRSPEAD